MRKIKCWFSYCCSPIWIEQENKENPIFENVDIDKLPLEVNSHLLKEIEELDAVYQSTFNTNYPPEPINFNAVQEVLFANRAIMSFRILKKMLPDQYKLVGDVAYWENRILELNIHES